jgi:hypothetical protein
MPYTSDTKSGLTTSFLVATKQRAERKKYLRQKGGYQGGFGMTPPTPLIKGGAKALIFGCKFPSTR